MNRTIPACVALAALAGAGSGRAETAPPSTRPATAPAASRPAPADEVKRAVRELYEALKIRDVKAAQARMVLTPRFAMLVREALELQRAREDFVRRMQEEYSQEPLKSRTLPGPPPWPFTPPMLAKPPADFDRMLAAAKVHVKRDAAQCAPDGTHPVTLVRREGRWLVLPAAELPRGSDFEEQLLIMIFARKAITNAGEKIGTMLATAAIINEDLANEMARRLMAISLMRAHGALPTATSRPATRPGAEP